MRKKCTYIITLWLILLAIFTGCRSNLDRPIQDGGRGEKKHEITHENTNENTNKNPFEKILNEKSITETVPERTVKKDVYLGSENFSGLKESEVSRRLLELSESTDIEPRNAVLDGYTWRVKKRGMPGKRINFNKTKSELLNSPEGRKYSVVIEEVQPDITSAELRGNIKQIGSYTTPLMDRSPSRMINIKIASKKVNYEKLLPGEEFSFNDMLGKRTKEKGYAKAPIILKVKDGPKKVYDYGGGICQLSSTMYNAVMEAKLPITERHTHSKQVTYVPKGKDAAVSYGSSDFKFKNNRKFPIMIRVYLTDKRLTVKIFENRNI